ncbi:MAG TPA: hypothetical protein VK524_34460 [Polyangiaceae bacterium]|nr:hypothetical protein [Polyangiaceae bacterium]
MTAHFPFTLYSSPVDPPVAPPSDDVLTELLGERFRDAAIALLPPGAALCKEPDSNIGMLLWALMMEYARIQVTADALRTSSPPSALSSFLDEWEDALGLPGECIDVAPTLASDRAGAVIAKLRGRRTRNQSAYEAAAAALGYPELEFERHAPLDADNFVAGSDAYSDEWAYVVRIIVQVSDQTADATLICMFTDQLRRAHAYLDIVLEGPMGAERKHYETYLNAQSLGSAFTGAAFEIRYGGHVSIVMEISNGAGIAPTDTPLGTWVYETSIDGTKWIPETDTAITTPIGTLAAVGNTLVSKVAKLSNVGGKWGRLRYVYTSGGAVSAKVSAAVSTW